jgi:hypothetical protein
MAEMGSYLNLREVLPELAEELEQLLRKQNEPELAAQVSNLRLCDRCRCGDDFCAMIYTLPPPQDRSGPNHRSFDLDAERGMIILDVRDERIACVEILNRDDIRAKVLALFP